MDIGQKIREVAELKDISTQELANRIGRTRQALYDIYNDRVSVNIEMLESIAKALCEPIANFFIDDPDTYYDNIPQVIPIKEFLKHMKHVHEKARRGAGLVNLRIFKSRDGMYIMESEFRDLKVILTEEEIEKFGDQVDESDKICTENLQ